MKFLSFAADGKEMFGAVSGDGIVTLNERIGQPDLRAALAAGELEAMRRAAAERQSRTASSLTVKFLPVIPHPAKILCAGINYRVARRRDRARAAEAAEHVRALHRHAGRP